MALAAESSELKTEAPLSEARFQRVDGRFVVYFA